MDRVLTAGPELAEGSATMTSLDRLSPLTLPPWGRAAGPAPTARSEWRWRKWDLLPAGFHLFVVAVLAASGYPAGRVAVVAAAAAIQQAHYLGWWKRDIRHCLNADAGRLAWIVAASQSCFLVTTAVAIAATGGVRSPLLLTIAGAYTAAVAAVGDRPQTRALLGATALKVGVVALLPRALTGPGLPGPAQALLTVASVIGLGALLAPVHARARQRRDAFFRARREL